MKKLDNKIVIYALMFTIVMSGLYVFMISSTISTGNSFNEKESTTIIDTPKAESVNPPGYYNALTMNGYVYNITGFDSHFSWYEGWTPVGDFVTNDSGLITVNFTGFFEKPDDSAGGNDVPYINISFFENNGNMQVLNDTLCNKSNTYAANNLALSYNKFRYGFLIPINELAEVKQQAYAQVQYDTSYGGIDWAADITINEFEDAIRFIFEKDDNSQNTTLIYDKTSGILIYAKVQSAYGPDFEITLDGSEVDYYSTFNKDYSAELDYEKQYIYNVTGFDSPVYWWDFSNDHYKEFVTNDTGLITVNFTGFYEKTSGDKSVGDNPVPYANVSFYENDGSSQVLNDTAYERSVSEAANTLAISYFNFRYGFLIPTNDFSYLAQLAYAQNTIDPDWGTDWSADINVTEYVKVIEFVFEKADNSQNTTLVYDKTTGILVYAKVQSAYGPDFEISLYEYEIEYALGTPTIDDGTGIGSSWSSEKVYYGTVDNGETIKIATLAVSESSPFIKIVVESDSSNWALSIIVRDASGTALTAIESGTSGDTQKWAIFAVTDSSTVDVYIKASFSPRSSGVNSGVNYIMKTSMSPTYKSYTIDSDEDDDEDDDKSTAVAIPSFQITLVVSIITITTIICIVKLKKRITHKF